MFIKNAKRIVSVLLAFMLTLVFAISVAYILESDKEKGYTIAASVCDCGLEDKNFTYRGITYYPYRNCHDDKGNFIIPDYYTGHENDYDFFSRFYTQWSENSETIRHRHKNLIVNSVGSFWTFGYLTGSGERFWDNEIQKSTILLTKDLDFLGKDFCVLNKFWGVFDGQGYAISNINLKGRDEYGSPMPMSSDYCFTLYLQGTIKNLKIENYMMSVDSSGFLEGSLFWANQDGAVIENCDISYILDSYYKKGGTAKIELSSQYSAGGTSDDKTTFKNCYITGDVYNWSGKNIEIYPFGDDSRITVENSVIVKENQNNKNHSGISMIKFGNTVQNNVQTQSGKPAQSFLYSSEGGADVAKAWYYGGSQYNSGYPYLRQFIRNWQTVNFTSNPSGASSFTPASIQIPSGVTTNTVLTSETITILGQTVTPNKNAGYQWQSWTKNSETSYTATFTLKTYTLTFTNATGTSGDIIPPSSSTTYTVQHGTTISPSQTTGNGPFTLTYTITQPTGSSFYITYTITEKYRLTSAGDTSSISGTRSIAPTVEVKKYTITFKGSSLTDQTSDVEVKNIPYDTQISIKKSNDKNISFYKTTSQTQANQLIRYQAKEDTTDYYIKYYDLYTDGITPDGQVMNFTITIKGDTIIEPKFAKFYDVAFADNIENATANEYVNYSTTMIEGSVVNLYYENNRTILKYPLTSSLAIIYEADENFIMHLDDLSIEITQHTTIAPTTKLYACDVTISKDDSDGIVETEIVGDTLDDDTIRVGFGTTITFDNTKWEGDYFVYIYKFSTGQVVKYKIHKDNLKYAMASHLDASDNRVWHTDLNQNGNSYDRYICSGPANFDELSSDHQYLEISPTFGLKSYNVELG